MKKSLFTLFTILIFCTNQLKAQYAVLDFFVLEDGMEKEYLELEKLWKEYHQLNADQNITNGWALWKLPPSESDDEKTAHYLTINQFTSKEQAESAYKNFEYTDVVKIIKKRMKGKVSPRQIDKTLGTKVKKHWRTYQVEMLDQTIFAGGYLKIGDKMNISPMIQKDDEYEKYESNVVKPFFNKNILRGNLRWWGFTKVVGRNKHAFKDITHFTWRIPVKGKKWERIIYENDFITDKIWDLTKKSRSMKTSKTMELIMKTN